MENKAKPQMDPEEWLRRGRLIHQVFEQNPHGKQLLNEWIENYVMKRKILVTDPFLLGREVERQEFVKDLKQAIDKINSI